MAFNIEKAVTSVILVIVGIVIIFQIMAAMATPLNQAAANIAAESATYGPLTVLFENGGVLMIILTVGVFLGLLFVLFRMFKRGR